MKRVLLFTWMSIGLLSPAVLAQEGPKGLLIYQEPASSSQEAMEYRSVRKDNALYSTLINPSGQRKQLKSAGVVGVIDYPPVSFDDSFPDVANATVNRVQALQRQFPQMQHQLEGVRGKWDRALSVYHQTHKAVAARSLQSVDALDLKTGQYSHARLNSATYDSATISHDAGVAKISLAELSVPQIVSLNATSETVQLGTTSFLDEQSASSQPGSLGNRINAAGARALAFVTARTGIRYDLIHGWLLFVIFPGLILVLLGASIARARKQKISKIPRARR